MTAALKVQSLHIPDDGLDVWLKDFAKVKLFRKWLKDQQRHYVVYFPEEKLPFQRSEFIQIQSQHWQIEHYHRAIRQVCHIEHFQVRNERLIRNHISAATCSCVYARKMQTAQVIMNIYQHQREVYKEIVAALVESFAKGKDHLLPKFASTINA